jgi:biphenyl 2,3-dioxygenase beta subunit
MTAQLESSPVTSVSAELQHQIEQYLYQEARFLDERRFEEWLDLFSDDTYYWMPTRGVRYERELDKEFSRRDEVSHFDETKRGLEERVTRIRSGMAWAEEPPSRTRHMVHNVIIEPGDSPDELLVRCNILLYRGRLDRDVDIFVGCREDVLRQSEDADYGWLIANRSIYLDQTVILAKNMSIFF